MSNVQILDRLRLLQDDLEKHDIDPQQSLLWVDISGQRLYVIDSGEVSESFPVSTAFRGTGCQQDSLQTPTGLHEICEMIGDGEPVGMVFKGRKPTGELAMIEAGDAETGQDIITSRILWLNGLEPGVNQGESVDTRERYIYIHGTNEEGRIGQPVSHGCIRMKNSDVISLFQHVRVGTPVVLA